MARFLRLLVTRRWGWTIIGLVVVLGGSLWGLSSPVIPYETSSSISYYIAAANDGNVYIYPTSSTNSTYFVARQADFNPPIDRTQIHLDTQLSFIARTDTISVNDTLTDELHVTQAHVIEELVLFNTLGSPTATYKTSDYNTNPNGYYNNRWWPTGTGIIFAGLLIAYLALFAGRKRRKKHDVGSGESGIPPYVYP